MSGMRGFMVSGEGWESNLTQKLMRRAQDLQEIPFEKKKKKKKVKKRRRR